MYYDRDEHSLYLLHSSLQLRVPVVVDWSQVRIFLGISCPRHRRLLKQRLGRVGDLLPDREWTVDEDGQDRLESFGGLWGRREGVGR